MADVIVYTDGACSGNPGPGGWAWVALEDGTRREGSGGEASTTNNRMELIAVIEALQSIPPGRGVEVRTDSQYVKNGITSWIHAWKRNGWRTASKSPVKNRELWEELDRLAATRPTRFVWVEGHAGEELNERCDELARGEIARLRG
ncbi:MAG: ribonuclease HI [Treponema sp.]|nr:ribonuclease HI [Treponema sp.]